VYGIVKQSGGHIWVYSEIGRGTTFKVYLPRTEEAEDELQPQLTAARTLRGSETVLLVEDEEMVREFVAKVLTRHGYAVHPTADPQQALDYARACRDPIDVILTDVVLPEMNGRAMAAEVQRGHPESKVLYMSGYTDDAIMHHGMLDAGMWFLQKPFSGEALLTKVRDLLDTRSL
jgi:DNA-binding response OmpR family regulator